MIAAVNGSRKRLAAALGVAEREIAHEFMRRMANPQPVIEVPSAQAPVHQVVRRGDDIDLTRLPFHVQHEYDGGAYISSGIDFTADPATGKTNVGCRRLMLRSRDTMRSNLTDASDLKNIYLGCLKRGERLPVSFAIGSHPLDYMAATCKMPIDEFGLVGDAARRAGADGARRHQRRAGAGRRRDGHRGLFRRARLPRAGRPLRRVLRLLRAGAHRPGVPRHRDHACART